MNKVVPIDLPSGPTVSAEWLRQHLDHPNLRILDTRGRLAAPGETAPQSMQPAWEAGHVPNAAFVHWNVDFVDVDDPVATQLAGPERFAASASRLGIGPDTVVVAYDDGRSMFAGRLWWALRAMGHDHVRVLDGGWEGWRAAGCDIATASPTIEPAHFVPAPRVELRWTIDQVAQRSDDVVLVDARSRDRFAGTGADPVGGHIPGAVNVPYDELVDTHGALRPERELRAAFLSAGIDPTRPPRTLVVSCGSGISASLPLLALEQLAPGAGTMGAVYDGSWTEWSRSGLPVARGELPHGETSP